MLNNKGQSLVLFVIILPILLLISILVIDIGRVFVLKQELNNISDIVLNYGLDILDDENLQSELYDLIELNNSEIDSVDIKIQDEKIHMVLTESVDGIFSKLIKISVFTVKTEYVAYIENDNKKVERISG